MRPPVPRSTVFVLSLLLLAGVVLPAAATNASSPRPSSSDAWAQFDAAFAALAPRASFLAADIAHGRCRPIHAITPDRRLALASTFKLYVLAELARQIEAGQASWDEVLPIQDHLKSLPTGNTLYEPAGTPHTLRDLAERMIAESDNTATDHLIARLGRKNVEAAMVELGHGAPELNTPLLMTRELFAFKIAVAPERIDAYLAASDPVQRQILAAEVDPIVLDPAVGWGSWVAPKRIDSIEWFASASEVCEAVAWLYEASHRPGLGPIREILGKNRGSAFDSAAWPYAGFKGGYEAGVYNQTWLLRRVDGRVLVVTAGLNDPVNYINLGAAQQLMRVAAGLLATAP